MPSLQYYLYHLVPLVLAIAGIFFLLGLGLGWLAWSSYATDVDHWEDERDRLRREVRQLKLD